MKLLTSGIGGKDHGGKTQGAEALDKDDITILGGDSEKTFTQQMVCGLISNMQCGRMMAFREKMDMPHLLMDRARGGHRPSINMGARRWASCNTITIGEPTKGQIRASKLQIEM